MMSTGKGQYKNIKWESIAFDKPYKTPNGTMISGYHIMNYRISESDIRRAVLKYGKKHFYDWGVAEDLFCNISEPGYVDYDPQSGNFHKNIQDRYQIVLVKKGVRPEGPGVVLTKKADMIRYLRENQMYFPNIDDYNSKMAREDAEKEMLKFLGIEISK